MARAYLRGRELRPEDVDAWMAAAAPYLPGPGGRVVDLGAGTGRFTAALARTSGASVVACEPSPAMRAVFPAGLALIGGAAERLPLATGSVDAVWASQMLHHVRDLGAFARGVRRVLRPGGHLLLRGGFGPPEQLVLRRWFPAAFGDHFAGLLADAIAELDRAGVSLTARTAVSQRYAGSARELVAKVATRSLSNLAGLSDDVFAAGLRDLERAAPGLDFPLDERLDLVVYTAAGGHRRGA
jgi:SAM-dependent methyltransferase